MTRNQDGKNRDTRGGILSIQSYKRRGGALSKKGGGRLTLKGSIHKTDQRILEEAAIKAG